MSHITGKGSCLCGAVRFTVNEMNTDVGACHCDMCRQWSSGPFMAVDCGTDVHFASEEQIGIYKSSVFAERGFCKKCGSNLFWRMNHTQQHMMAAGLFDEEPNFTLDNQVFIDKKPTYYSFAEKTTDITEAEVLAEYPTTS